MENWQLCPKCKGTGQSNYFDGSKFSNQCDVCNGSKIISLITGRPPQGTTTSNSSTISNQPLKQP